MYIYTCLNFVGFHNKLNQSARRNNLVLWELIELINQHADNVVSVRLMVNNNVPLNKQNARYNAVSQRLNRAWREYQTDKDIEKLWRFGAHCIKY